MILILGGSGLLGSEMVLVLGGHAPGRDEFDISNPEHVAGIVTGQYKAVINCAAYTAVDLAESHPDEAAELNELTPAWLARACASVGVPLVHFSTDYVFDGTATEPYTEESPTNPQSVYGRTKLAGEQAVLEIHPMTYVLRTSWLFGSHGKCFPRSIWQAHQAGKPLRVVDDQWGCPTEARCLAEVVRVILERKIEPGLYHACGPEAMTWFEFAQRVLPGAEITPTSSKEWEAPAPRPRFSVLSCSRLVGAGVEWPEGLDASIERVVGAWGS